jgi:hypothetical protein
MERSATSDPEKKADRTTKTVSKIMLLKPISSTFNTSYRTNAGDTKHGPQV